MKPNSLLATLTVGHFANDWSVCSIWLIAPAIGIAMDLSPAKVGLLITLVEVGGALAYLPAGMLTDHVSDRGKLLLGTFWWVGIGYLLAALAPGFWSLALVLAIAGMGDAAWHPIATGLLAREQPEKRAHVLGVHAIGGSLAEVLSPLFAGFLLAFVDWQVALALAGVPALAMGVYFLWYAKFVPVIERRRFDHREFLGLLKLWRTRNGVQMVVMVCLYNMALMGLLAMIPLYLADRHGMGLGAAGVAFSTMLIVGALTQPWVGKISDRVGRRPVAYAGNFTAAAAAAAIAFHLPLVPAIAVMIVAVATLSAIRAAILAGMVDHAGRSEGTTLGLAFVLMDGVGALGAVFAGLAANLSWTHAFGLSATFALGAGILAFVTVFAQPTATGTPPEPAVAE
ncbi:MAG: MFS transporter [Rhodospirillales bacterium]